MKIFSSSLIRNVLYLFIVQGSNYMLPLLTFPYLVRVLGVEKFGIFGFSQATILYFILLIDYGFNFTATQEVAKNGNDKQAITKLFWSVISAKSLLFIIAILIIYLLTLLISNYKENAAVLWSFVPALIGSVIYPVWLFQGKQEMKWLTLTSISSRIIILPVTFIAVHNSDDVAIAAFIYSSTNFIAGIIAVSIIFKRKWVGTYYIKSRDIILNLKNGWHVFASTSAISLYTIGIVIALGFITGPVAVGYFNTANTLRNAVQGLIDPITQAVYPRIASKIIDKRSEGIALVRKSLFYLALISLFFSSILFFGSSFLIEMTAGHSYEKSVFILKILSPLPFLIALSNVYGIQVMLIQGYKKQFSRILLFAGVISLVMIFPMAFCLGETGAALTLSIAELIVTLMMFFFVKRNKLLSYY